MVPLLVLIAAVVVAGALVWRLTIGPPTTPRAPRSAPPAGMQESDPTEEETAEGFVFSPAPRQEERPRRAFAAIRLVLTISIVAGAIAAGLYYLGYFVKLQLDRIFGS